jgi:replicative DNA helicase
MKSVSADSFHIPSHRLLYEQLMEMYQAARAIDLLTIGEALKTAGRLEQIGGYAFLEGLIDSTPTAAHAEFYIDIILQKHLLRRIITQAAETIDSCYSPDEEAEELLSRTEEAFFELSDTKTVSAEDWQKVVYKTAGQIIDGNTLDSGVPTGFADLDKQLRGLHNTDMIVLAARPSMGKTSLAMNIAEHAALGRGGKKHAVGVFSLEMSQEQLVRRMLYSKAGVPAWKDFFSEADRSRLSSAADQLGKASIIVDDSAGLDVMDLRARARRMKRIYGIELIVIDYLQLLHDKRRSRDGRQQETASISNSIKAMAKELKLPVLVLSQLSRAPEQGGRDGNKPRLSDLRDSGAIEQDADVVLLLQRPSYYNKELEAGSGEDTLAVVDIAKHRNGPTAEVKLNFFREITRFEDRDTRHGMDEAAE